MSSVDQLQARMERVNRLYARGQTYMKILMTLQTVFLGAIAYFLWRL